MCVEFPLQHVAAKVIDVREIAGLIPRICRVFMKQLKQFVTNCPGPDFFGGAKIHLA
jgi:hypothetical protein